MVTMRRGLRAQGLKSSTISHVLASRRQSTNRLYDIRWSVWFDFCISHRFNALYPSVSEFAQFLTFLFEVKRLSPVTIAGYKSAISLTVSIARGVRSPSFAQSVIISHLLDGFKRKVPAQRTICPRWDITVVLKFLREVCEPLDSISLRLLTFKTVFLVAMATARRVSGINAISGLSKDIAFDRNLSHVSLCFLPEFRAKNQSVNELSRPFIIPALKQIIGQDDEDICLCPVRALNIYLLRTQSQRAGKRRLFISLNDKYSKDIQKGTISRWTS